LALAGRAGGLAGDAGGDHGRHIVYFGLREELVLSVLVVLGVWVR
jgi:hypothetical protein